MEQPTSSDGYLLVPWRVLVARDGHRAAAYNHIHRLIVPRASKELIDYAREHCSVAAAFDLQKWGDRHAPWNETPPWAPTAQDLDGATLLWIPWPQTPQGWAQLPAA